MENVIQIDRSYPLYGVRFNDNFGLDFSNLWLTRYMGEGIWDVGCNYIGIVWNYENIVDREK